ncbi:unnamed protein product [Clonostachys solani]|uniref:Heterokaryon incompatibility domain-containing protein n=1 Tax=Clonostachys solani TaxID=160281 RepID=A0A9N9W8K6_9HYPO|nr:unnamed protein product [Clonostachys solani]
MAEFRAERPICDLPKTFQDAIVIARKLSVRYLWIDALCIIQDSMEDVQRQIPLMERIYSQSAVNIAASASADPHGGLFRAREPAAVIPGLVSPQLHSGVSENEKYYIFDRKYWDRQISNGPLHRRGWVFQERLLAPRVIYFSKQQVFWECFTENKCEAFPYGIPKHHSIKRLEPLWEMVALNRGKTPLDRQDMPGPLLDLWGRLVREYSNCVLTNSNDKLAALLGIVGLFATTTGDQYLAGMWRSSLLEQLCWWVDQPGIKGTTTTTGTYCAPSWSWASLSSPNSTPRLNNSETPHTVFNCIY